MTAPKEIRRLIERFRENRDVYCSSAYNEAQARHEFIDPLVEVQDEISGCAFDRPYELISNGRPRRFRELRNVLCYNETGW